MKLHEINSRKDDYRGGVSIRTVPSDIKAIWRIFIDNGIRPENEENYSITKTALYVVVSVMCFMLTFLNYRSEALMMTIGTAVIGVSFLGCAFINYRFHWYNVSAAYLCALLMLSFTNFIITGTNNGFACLWLIMIPLFAMGFCGVPWGAFIGFYFFGLLHLVFYGHFRYLVVDKYSDIMLQRFPLLYGMSFIISLILMYQKHAMHIRQLNNQRELESAVLAERERVTGMSVQTIQAILNAVEAKDSYTNEHSRRVAEYSVMIAKEMGLCEEQIGQIRYIALLHDIGKIGIRSSILNKKEALTEEEYTEMKKHTIIGADILKDLNMIPNIELGAKYHHEHYDGSGYPQGIAGTDIPFEARIIAVADAYDAMASKRSYRDVLPQDTIRQEIESGKGACFDPEIADVMLRLIDRDFEYQMREVTSETFAVTHKGRAFCV